MARPTLMMIGVGDLGGHVLEMICRAPGHRRIITADINEEWGIRKTNIARYGASQIGYYPDLEFTKIDLFHIEQSAEIIAKYQPDVIYSAATLQSWWVINTLPKEVFDELDLARFGPWLPQHLTIVWKLMQAVKLSGVPAKVINSAFPDACGPVLKSRGLQPDVGIGNVANPVPAIRYLIAEQLGLKLHDVTIYFACQHYVSHYIPRFGTAGNAPYYLKAYVGGRDVTKDVDIEKAFAEMPKKGRRAGGRDGQILTASSASAVILAMLDDTGDFTHAPAPDGLPGGYPVKVDRSGATVALPNDITLEEAIEINEKGQKADGIESIDPKDGTVRYCDWSIDITKRMFGYDVRTMKLEEVEEVSKELTAKFQAFASKFKK